MNTRGILTPWQLFIITSLTVYAKENIKNGAPIKCNTSELNRGYINIYLTSMGKSRYNIIITTIRTIHIKVSIVLDLMYGVWRNSKYHVVKKWSKMQNHVEK